VGNRFIQQGDYEVVHSAESEKISRSKFASVVEVGMVLEMSIILRQDAAFQDNKETCPRCRHINRNIINTASNSWIKWQVPLNISRTYRPFVNPIEYSSNCWSSFLVQNVGLGYGEGDEEEEFISVASCVVP
jgi:hypothetical protein